MKCFRWYLLFSLCTFIASIEASLNYTVQYLGIDDSAVKTTLRSATALSTLKKHAPDTLSALKYRAESDIPTILKVMRSYGYYEAKVSVRVEEGFEIAAVFVSIDPGPVYTLKSFHIDYVHAFDTKPKDLITLASIGVEIDAPMSAKGQIIAEENILSLLSKEGYPLAQVDERTITADGETKTVAVDLQVKTGPRCTFGPLTIEGNTHVHRSFFHNKLQWKEGKIYDSDKTIATQKILSDSSLFSSVLITHGEPTEAGQLPMHIEVVESKHRSINAGVSYQTYYGPGLTFGWESRNMAGMGQRLSIQGDVTRRSHSGLATYLFPDWYRKGQDFVVQAQAMQENILPYAERTYNIAPRVERRIGKKIRMSFGGKMERLLVTASVHNGRYWLLESPLYFAWNGSDSILNPTEGLYFEFTTTPTVSAQKGRPWYWSNVLAVASYLPVTKTHSVVLAQKITVGSIFSKNLSYVPVSKRFFGGSEEDLRGYAYQSVSPIAPHHKPIGGRSEVFYTLEPRLRVSKTIGLVPFFDMGNVYSAMLPSFSGKWLKSVGLGLRYFSFMGPFRLDVGFPLEKRKEIDKFYRILVSIGQTF